MRSVLILDSQAYRRKLLVRYLCEAGYDVCGISEAQYCHQNDYSKFDLVIVNFYPDAAGTWDFYMGLKKKYPDLPVLVYLQKSFHAFRSLKQAIDSVVSYPEKSCRLRRPVRAIRPLAGIDHGSC
ncbi:DNA-binding NtrC family response regulator [Desulfosalsimonas propionicica]|uniref:DNA-binding NtrC family response regulator n=1 Tax=Desulfosalsimonas propionicica TaxID=332175 RepID=A0A7W0HJL6_9BACT|nr:hypothetical protein [Desulfosalsimonas propionicica]MBA2880325.1 DNA-binding NtrC family response regulator [Desulfosalsimonas propionicica]